jgi:hypothetical protein
MIGTRMPTSSCAACAPTCVAFVVCRHARKIHGHMQRVLGTRNADACMARVYLCVCVSGCVCLTSRASAASRSEPVR